MKFQCGECNKYFAINNSHIINDDLEFQCDNCSNHFSINRNLVFSSAAKNSKMVCENCGKLVPETSKSCSACNLILNKTHEELRIDNKYYESLEIDNNGDIAKSNPAAHKAKKRIGMPAIVTTTVILVGVAVGYLVKTDRFSFADFAQSQNLQRIEKQIILMQSGKTYIASKVEPNGIYLTLTTENGAKINILKNNVLQLSKAVIEE